jgi:hypothetical protein
MTRCAGASNQNWTWSSTTQNWKNGNGLCMNAPTAANGAALTEATCTTAASEKFTNV